MVGTATGKIGHLAKDHAEWASRSEKGHAPTQNHKARAKTAVDLEIVLKELHAILVKSAQVSNVYIFYWFVWSWAIMLKVWPMFMGFRRSLEENKIIMT